MLALLGLHQLLQLLMKLQGRIKGILLPFEIVLEKWKIKERLVKKRSRPLTFSRTSLCSYSLKSTWGVPTRSRQTKYTNYCFVWFCQVKNLRINLRTGFFFSETDSTSNPQTPRILGPLGPVTVGQAELGSGLRLDPIRTEQAKHELGWVGFGPKKNYLLFI